jgi:hypothetical protein
MELLPLVSQVPSEFMPVVALAIVALTLYRAVAPLFKRSDKQDEDPKPPAIG